LACIALRSITVALFVLLAACRGNPRIAPRPESFSDVETLVESVRHRSFPQLQNAKITIYDLHSDFDYLQARFTVSSFFSRELSYMILFNPEAIRRGVPPDGLRAIVAHELAHINYYESQSRMGLLSLVRLLVPSFTTRFERRADLDTIALGYARGLEQYRVWLYRNVPAGRASEKRRDYYTPEEIEALLQAQKDHPGIMSTFMRCVPRNLAEIQQEARSPASACPA
jgi:hypothetical protein